MKPPQATRAESPAKFHPKFVEVWGRSYHAGLCSGPALALARQVLWGSRIHDDMVAHYWELPSLEAWEEGRTTEELRAAVPYDRQFYVPEALAVRDLRTLAPDFSRYHAAWDYMEPTFRQLGEMMWWAATVNHRGGYYPPPRFIQPTQETFAGPVMPTLQQYREIVEGLVRHSGPERLVLDYSDHHPLDSSWTGAYVDIHSFEHGTIQQQLDLFKRRADRVRSWGKIPLCLEWVVNNGPNIADHWTGVGLEGFQRFVDLFYELEIPYVGLFWTRPGHAVTWGQRWPIYCCDVSEIGPPARYVAEKLGVKIENGDKPGDPPDVAWLKRTILQTEDANANAKDALAHLAGKLADDKVRLYGEAYARNETWLESGQRFRRELRKILRQKEQK